MTATVEILTGTTTGQFILKAATGAYMGTWTTQDPVGEFSFANITQDKYIHQILIREPVYVGPNGNCGGNSPCYKLIQGAVNAAATCSAILIPQGTYSEAITINESKSLTLQGGWDSSYTNQTPNTTFIKAPKAPQGSLRLQEVIVKPQ
jgi:hypothetical protein